MKKEHGVAISTIISTLGLLLMVVVPFTKATSNFKSSVATMDKSISVLATTVEYQNDAIGEVHQTIIKIDERLDKVERGVEKQGMRFDHHLENHKK